MAVLRLFDAAPAAEFDDSVTSALTPFPGFIGITLCSVTDRQRASTDLGLLRADTGLPTANVIIYG